MIANVWTIANREFFERARDRGFLISTLFTMLLAVGGGILGGILGGADPKEYTVGVVGSEARTLSSVMAERAPLFGVKVVLEPITNRRDAELAVKDDEVDLAVIGRGRVIADGELESSLETLAQSSAAYLRTVEALQEGGVPAADAKAALNPSPLAIENVDPQKDAEGKSSSVALGGVAVLFITVFGYGLWIATGVVEEKASRVVEVVLSAVKPWQLLVGKVTGIGLLALGQLALFGVGGIVAAKISGFELPPAAIGIAGGTLLWFALGFVFYGFLFAVAGSLVSKQEDLQYTSQPLILLLFAGFGVAFYQFGAPGSLLTRVLSFVPPFSPLLMPLRMGSGGVSALEVLGAILVMLFAIAGLVAFSSRLYAGSVLRFGARVPLREAWRTLRPKDVGDDREIRTNG
jgi:ABC-2 type transport system permease protein